VSKPGRNASRRYLFRGLSALVVGVAVLVGGCDQGDPPEQIEPSVGLPFPDTPDQLIDNFKTAYGGMDLEAYRDDVLSDQYTFVLQPETVEEFALADSLFDRDDELAIAETMFSGQPNAWDRVLTSIEMLELQPLSAWEAVPANDPYFGSLPETQRRRFSLIFYFAIQGDFRYEVLGAQVFYVECDSVLHRGVMTPRYRLRGQIDQTVLRPGKGTDQATWGTVKALWH
jgi:hypothetical protein